MAVGVWVCSTDTSSSNVLTRAPVSSVACDSVALSSSEGSTDPGTSAAIDGLFVVAWKGVGVDSELLSAVGVKPKGLSVVLGSMLWGEGVG